MNDPLQFAESRLAAALDCNADLNRQFFAKSLELSKLKDALQARIEQRQAYLDLQRNALGRRERLRDDPTDSCVGLALAQVNLELTFLRSLLA